MKHIEYFESFNLEEQQVKLIKEQIAHLLNEKKNTDIDPDDDIDPVWMAAVQIAKKVAGKSREEIIKYTVFGLLALYSSVVISRTIDSSDAPESVKKVAYEILNDGDKFESEPVKKVIDEVLDDDGSKFKPGQDFRLSQSGWDHVREEEGLKLRVYRLGDKKSTVGYGHAEDIETSKFRVGQKISKIQAQKYLEKDLKTAADGVRRIFKNWSERGQEVRITQSMFDVLVSLAYNAGVGALERSDLIKVIKTKDFDKAANMIKSYRVGTKFKGLKTRREEESKLFLKDLALNK